MAAAATMAMDMESSIVIRLAATLSRASLKIGQPPIKSPATPITLTLGSGSQKRNHTAVAAKATKRIRSISDHRSEEHTSELQSLMRISYAVFCLKKQIQNKTTEQKQ